jgi:hypothetical protein
LERLVAVDVLRIADGEFVFRIADPKVGSLQGPVLEIGPSGVLIATRQQFDASTYETVLDVTIELKGHMSRQFFASVTGNESGGVRLAWLNIDPGQQGRLKVLLDAYKVRQQKAAAAPADPNAGNKTRRLVKPSSAPAPAPAPRSSAPEVLNLFGGDPTPPPSPVVPATPATADAGGDRVGTRRVLKPGPPAGAVPAKSGAPMSLFGGDAEAAPTTEQAGETGPSDDSKAHSVVVAPTAKFEKLGTQPTSAPKSSAGDTSHHEDEDLAAAADAGKTVVGQDGRMDIGATLRNKAKTVRASELAARHDKVRVLNLATIRALIMDAVEDAASHLSRALSEGERKRLLEEAEEGFQERMKAFQLEKASADEKSKKLAEQLFTAQKLLEDERKRTISADQFTVSSAGLGELEAGFQKLIDRAQSEGKIDESLEGQLRKLAERVFDEERQRIREKEMSAQNDKIDLLEKKIKRLAGNLEETEKQRDEAREIAQALEKMGGQGLSMEQIKNKYKIGLSKDDPRREAKMAIMKELLDQNRELRRKLGIALNEVKPEPAKAEVAAEPVAEAAAPASAEAEEPVAEGEESTADLVNPDDEPWSPDETAGDSAASDVNPDDMPWEPPAAAAAPADSVDEGGVKILRAYKTFEPPPLIKK